MNAPWASLSAMLRDALHTHAEHDRTAFITGDGDTRYAELSRLVDAYAFRFHELGIVRGQLVGLIATKTVPAIAAFLGIMQAGGCPSFVEPRLAVDELATRMNAVGMRLLLSSDAGQQLALATRLNAFGMQALCLADLPAGPGFFIDETLDAHDRAMLLFTSGSSGKPKGVLLSHGNLICNAVGISAHTHLTEADRLLHIMPLHHTNGINNQLIAPLLQGAQIILVERFQAGAALDSLRRHQPTYVTGVPTMYSRMLPLLTPGERFPSLRFLRCGSAPITPVLHDAIETAFAVPLLVSYGLSEATCTSTMNPPGERRVGSIGTVLPGQDVRLFVPGGSDVVSTDSEGEIRIGGPSLMLGYIGADVETPIVDGWLRTGDLGRFDPAGFLSITGRIKDVIIRGGENLSPALIESHLATHPDVRECCVVGVHDADLGEVPVAFVVAHPDRMPAAQLLKDHILTSLSRSHVPAEIHLLAALPLSSVGKIDRSALKELRRLGLADASERPLTLRFPDDLQSHGHRMSRQ